MTVKLNWANRITIFRILLIVPFVSFMLQTNDPALSQAARYGMRYVSVGLFLLMAISDGVDGYLARKRNQITKLGAFLDPIADKLLIAGALIALVQLGELSAAAVMALIAREFLVTGLRIIAIHEGMVISASLLGKLKTISHVILVLVVLAARTFALGPAAEIAKTWSLILALSLSVISGAEYFYRSRQLFSSST